jgi:metallo-beta-lactamase class B
MNQKLAVVVALLVTLTPVATDAQNPNWSAPSQPYWVAGNVYNVGTRGIGVYLIATPKGLILLDSATSDGVEVVKANITALGFKLSDIRYLIETHAHFDHVGGTANLKRATGAMLIASAADRPALERGRHDGDNVYGVGKFAPVKVDRLISDGSTLSLGGTTLTAHLTPGHSKGCTSWSMTVGEGRQRLRILFYGSTTTAGNVLVGNKSYPNIVGDYRRTFAKLKTIKADIFLTNHPEFADLDGKRAARIAGKADAFIDPGALPTFVSESEAAFEAELKQQQETPPKL